MAEPSLADARASRSAGAVRPAGGRQRLLAAAEQLLATRGLEVPSRVIVAAAGQHNQSAITYHFGSRAGLIDAIRERHQTPIAQHRRHLISRLPGPGDRTTRQLIEAYIQPLTAEMLRGTPSHWARFSEMLLLDRPLQFTRDTGLPAPAPPDKPARPALPELPELMVAHLTQLPEPEAADRVALAIRFLISSLARWERDSQAGLDFATALAPFSLILTDLAVAMLDAPGSVRRELATRRQKPTNAGHAPSPHQSHQPRGKHSRSGPESIAPGSAALEGPPAAGYGESVGGLRRRD